MLEACNFVYPRKRDNIRLARLLLIHGDDPNQFSNSGTSPVDLAIQRSSIGLLDLLLDHGAFMHKHPAGPQHDGPVELAITLGNNNVVEVMVFHKRFGEATEEQHGRYMYLACVTTMMRDFGTGSIMDFLLHAGFADPNMLVEPHTVPLIYLPITMNNFMVVRLLMRHGADIHRPLTPRTSEEVMGQGGKRTTQALPEGPTPLHYAIMVSDGRMVDFMLGMRPSRHDPGEHLSLRRGDVDPPLTSYARAACRDHNPDMIAVIFQFGHIDVNIIDENGNTPLIMLCACVEKDARKSAQGLHPNSDPTILAVTSSECISRLLACGADPNLVNNEGVTPLDYIRRMAEYSGDCVYLKEVAKTLGEVFLIDEDGIEERMVSDP